MEKNEFIEKAIAIHGDKYDYSKVEYKNNKTKVCIICPKHGEFMQRPYAHLGGGECPKCSLEKREEKKKAENEKKFIEKAKKVHGDKFDYSKVNYVDERTKVCIICPEHGEFWQQPMSHIKYKYGCEKCGRKYQKRRGKLTIEEFIEKANKVHNNKYDYSKTEYITAQDKVCIICPEHGEFWQKANSHLRGQGCPKCANKYSGSKNGKMTTEEFIELARAIHGDKYDYSKVEYVNSGTKVCIICPEHGEFMQRPANHLQGEECKKCSTEKVASSQRINKEEILKRAKSMHGNKYDYSLFMDDKFTYSSLGSKMPIICHKTRQDGSEHGLFYQIVGNHLKGAGCPICNESKLEKQTDKILSNKSIKFTREKDFDWLKNVKPLHLDFYLHDYNIAIECQGKQHFEENECFGSKSITAHELYEYVHKIDTIKFNLCAEHGIPVEYINYNDDVEKRINEILEKHKNIAIISKPIDIDKIRKNIND